MSSSNRGGDFLTKASIRIVSPSQLGSSQSRCADPLPLLSRPPSNLRPVGIRGTDGGVAYVSFTPVLYPNGLTSSRNLGAKSGKEFLRTV